MIERTVWVDITSSMTHPTRRVSGIQRVELEVALGLADQLPVEFVHYDFRARRFVAVSRNEVAERQRLLVAESSAVPMPVEAPARARRARAGAWVTSRVPRRLRPDLAMKAAWQVERAVTATARLVRRELERLISVGRPHSLLDRRTPGGRPDDVLLILTLHYDPEVIDEVRTWVRGRGMELVTLVYDVTPSILPQVSTLDPSQFDANFVAMVEQSARLLTISECSATDIRDLCARQGIDCPPIDVLRLASALTRSTPCRPEGVSLPDDFVLCVGTVEPRKNHALLLDVWESFTHDHVADAPVLVIAGSTGWLVEETMDRIRNAPELRDTVVFVDSPSDPELHWLFRNCTFTLYPSLYEGWGLPVTESFDSGKVCLTTDRGSLPEAGEGLAIHLDATDRAAWREAILDLWRDADRRQRLEQHIVGTREPREISAVAADLAEILGGNRTDVDLSR